jgi:hypothetical protein
MYWGQPVGEIPEADARGKAVELSPINHLERFYDLPMYARFGELDRENGSEGALRFITALKNAGQTIQELYIIENGGHGIMQDGTPFPDPGRMSDMEYIKSHMGLSKNKVWLINLSTSSESNLQFELEDTSTDDWRLIAGSGAVERNSSREKILSLFSVKEGTYDLSNTPWEGTGIYWPRIFTWDPRNGSILYVPSAKSEFSGEVTKIDFQNFKQAGSITITDCSALNGKEIDIFLYIQETQELLDSIPDLPASYGWGFRGIVEDAQYSNWLGLESTGYFWGLGDETINLTVGIATVEENPAWYVTTRKMAITVNTQLSFTDFEVVNH